MDKEAFTMAAVGAMTTHRSLEGRELTPASWDNQVFANVQKLRRTVSTGLYT